MRLQQTPIDLASQARFHLETGTFGFCYCRAGLPSASSTQMRNTATERRDYRHAVVDCHSEPAKTARNLTHLAGIILETMRDLQSACEIPLRLRGSG
jgi:hypothetical protein